MQVKGAALKQVEAIQHPEFIGGIGLGRADITPPSGIYSKLWGAAVHSVASGVHKPLYASCILFRNEETDLDLFVLTADLSWWRSSTEEQDIRQVLLQRCQLDESQLILHLSHSHSAPSTSLENIDEEGGALIPAFRKKVLDGFVEVIEEARFTAKRSCLTWSTGKCQLAFNRDQNVKTATASTTIVGLNIKREADDTLLVGRVTDLENNIRAVIVNYACHPVSLGSGNSKISPDYIGKMREIVEAEIDGGICLFLHGASGDLTPRLSYSSNTEDADTNGAEIGYAILATLAGMLPAQTSLAFDHVVESGASLGQWELKETTASKELAEGLVHVELSYANLPTLQEIDEQILQADEGYVLERLKRRRLIRMDVGEGTHQTVSFPVWRVGGAVFVALKAEAYSKFQISLRQLFPNTAVICMNIANGYLSYFPSEEAYGMPDLYQVKVAIFEKGCLEKTIEKSAQIIEQLLG